MSSRPSLASSQAIYCRIVSSGVASVKSDMSATGCSLITAQTDALNCPRKYRGGQLIPHKRTTDGSRGRTSVRTNPIFSSNSRSCPSMASSGASLSRRVSTISCRRDRMG